MKNLISILLTSISFICFSQNNNLEDWTENEKAQYSKLTELAQYVTNKQQSEISKDTLFDKYIFFDYVLNDTDKIRRERRLAIFDTVFYRFRKIIDTIGILNFEAKPIRFYKNHEIYKPFDEELTKHKTIAGEKMYTKSENVFAYYKKEEPENPLGKLLFEPETSKLVAWIMIDQGGYKYFLIFNLL